eukprot:gene11343-12526_t
MARINLILILSILFLNFENNNVSSVTNNFYFDNVTSHYADEETNNQVIGDMRNALNESGTSLEIGIILRYPQILNITLEILKDAQNATEFDYNLQCTKIKNALQILDDGCLELWNHNRYSKQYTDCLDSDKEGKKIVSDTLQGICNKSNEIANKADELVSTASPKVNATSRPIPPPFPPPTRPVRPPTRPMRPPPTLPNRKGPSPTTYLLIAIKTITKVALVNFRRQCEGNGRIFHYTTKSCTQFIHGTNGTNSTNVTRHLFTHSNNKYSKYVTTLSIVGHILTCICLIGLLITYAAYEKYKTLPGKNIICLSICLIFASILQLLIIHLASKSRNLCVIFGVLLHWCLLLSFIWMAIISYDFFVTFYKSKRESKRRKTFRFKVYCLTAFVLPTVIIIVCLMLDIPNKKITNYGVDGKCFVVKFWTNLFAFVVPVGLILVVNFVLLLFTIKALISAKKTSSRVSGSNRHEIVLTTLALKITCLVGLAWIMAFIDGFVPNIVVEFIYTFVVTFQGVFISFAFGHCARVLSSLSDICSKKENAHSKQSNITSDTKL